MVGPSVERWLLSQKLLDFAGDHRADFDQEHAARFETCRRLLDKRCDNVGSVVAGAEGQVRFVVADVAVELFHFRRRDVRRVADDVVESRFRRLG